MSKYQPQSKEEIVKGLESIANSRDVTLSDHVRASLWNAIEILEDIIEKGRASNPENTDVLTLRGEEFYDSD